MSKQKRKKGLHRKMRRGSSNKGQNSIPPLCDNTPGLDIQEALDQASRLFSQGHLAEAESLCRKILTMDSESIPALYGMGRIAQMTGRLIEAEQYVSKITFLQPDNHEAYNYLGSILRDLGKLDNATRKFQKAAELNPLSATAHNNLGNLYFSQNKLELAISSYQKAINISPQNSNYYFNLANVYNNNKLFDEAIASHQKAISLQPNHVGALYNLGLLFRDLSRLDEAFQSLKTAVEYDPGRSDVIDSLIDLLNNFMPNTEADCPYVIAQKSLQQVNKAYSSTSVIADETIRQIYQRCHSILSLHRLSIETSTSQLFRGEVFDINCPRHMKVFETFRIIPRYCFDCYKVFFEPRTVMELFKLLLLFDKIKLPNNNTRKCHVEKRPGISGTYKGFIYCKSLDEGKKILNIVQPIVGKTISEEMPISLKRGCSEFQVAYPSYGLIDDDKTQQMICSEEWLAQEVYADKNLVINENENPNNFTHNHSGFTLLDALVMRKWLAYAAKIEDESYLKIVE